MNDAPPRAAPVDYRDDLIADLADREALLLERVADLESERDILHLLATRLVFRLTDTVRQLDQVRASHRRALKENRELRLGKERAA